MELSEFLERAIPVTIGNLHREYPNGILHLLFDGADVQPPSQLHPACFGCVDSQSSVHCHWQLLRGIHLFPTASFAGTAQAALTLVKSRAQALGLDPSAFDKTDVHVHVPAGAIPKDGPSAGVAMYVALASLFSDRPVRSDTAMTGEISLRGLVLPVGGIKEKVLAALAAGIERVLLPARNRKDLDELPQQARDSLEFVFLDDVAQSMEVAVGPPAPSA